MSGKKYIISFIVLIILMIFTFLVLFKHFNITEIKNHLSDVNIYFILLAVCAVPIYLMSFGFTVNVILRNFDAKTSFWKGFSYGAIDFYYSAITPSSTGGQPLVIFHMSKDGVSGPVATVVTLVQTILFKLVLILCGFFAIILYPEILFESNSFLFVFVIIGAAVNIVFLIGIIITMFNAAVTKKIAVFFINLLAKLRLIKNPERITTRFLCSLDEYHEASSFIKGHKKTLLKAFFATAIQRLAVFTVPYLVFLSLGLKPPSPAYLICLQVLISLAVDVLPFPGGMGVTEFTTVMMYENIVGIPYAAAAMILTRGINYYLCLIFSSAIACGRYIILLLKRKKILNK